MITHTDPDYLAILNKNTKRRKANRYNGGYYCSKDIVEEIIPRVKTDRVWITINVRKCADHSLFFVHNYLHPEWYEFIKNYKDVILVCHHQSVIDKVKHLGRTILLPTFVNVDYVKQFRSEKTKGTAYVGRRAVRNGWILPAGIDYIENLPREELLREMSKYRTIYAIGRTAIEGKILGCEVKSADPIWPDTDYWQIFDVKEASKLLQDRLNRIDGVI